MIRTILFVSALFLAQPSFAGAPEAKAFVDSLASQVVNVLKNQQNDKLAKQTALETILRRSVDIPWVGRFVLGGSWRAATEQQRADYLKHYESFIVRTYTKRMSEYAGQEYHIKQVRADGEPGEYLLTMELITPNEPSVMVDYRLRERDGHYYIFDIIVEGVSMITTQRSEFASVVSRKGLDFLIQALEKKANG